MSNGRVIKCHEHGCDVTLTLHGVADVRDDENIRKWQQIQLHGKTVYFCPDHANKPTHSGTCELKSPPMHNNAINWQKGKYSL